MTIDNFHPTFRNVLLKELGETKTKGGLIMPTSSFTEDKNWLVLKVGKNCEEVSPGDIIKITTGIRPQTVTIDSELYSLVFEQQIVGYNRDASMADAPSPGSEIPGNS
jgi:co-chaperonin GroES (HSP10)